MYEKRKLKFDTDSEPIAIDSCASYSLTNKRDDFVAETINKVHIPIKGLGNTIARYKGTVQWVIQDQHGESVAFTLQNVLLVDNLPFRLLSPQHWAQCAKLTHGKCYTVIDEDQITLFWNGGKHYRRIPLSSSNIAVLTTAPAYKNYQMFLSQIGHNPQHDFAETLTFLSETPVPQLTNKSEMNNIFGDQLEAKDLSSRVNNKEETHKNQQEELFQWHCRLGHVSFAKLKEMAIRGDIPRSLATCQAPKCAACLYGKLTRRPWRNKKKVSPIKPLHVTQPGDCISVDQFESSTPGFIGLMRGFPTKMRYTAGTVFTDHHSRLSFVHLHKSLSATETLHAKHCFERYCQQHSIQVRHYHADNGRFADKPFLTDVENKGQTITFCAVNSHWQNGISEKRIRDLQDTARTMLLDAISRWPKALSSSLWPYAIKYANVIHNHTVMIRGQHVGKTPLEIFTRANVRPNLSIFHPFGCPVYVLNNRLQVSQQLNKWLPRARVGVYLGMSPHHARTVALVLNVETASVSPQFHVKFDDSFSTVSYPRNQSINISAWKLKAGFKTAQQTSPTTVMFKENSQQNTVSQPTTSIVERSIDTPDTTTKQTNETDNSQPNTASLSTTMEDTNETPETTEMNHNTTRPQRNRRTPNRFADYVMEHEEMDDPMAFAIEHEVMDEPTHNEITAMAFAARKGDPDTLYLHEAMRAPDADKFRQAMQKEIEAHENKGHWTLVKRNELPRGIAPLPAVWAMKRKRRAATGQIYKYKARLNVGGHKQVKHVNYWQTYSPVIGWPIVRLFLTFSIIHGWSAKQYDFELAYPQADIETTMYMDIPRGFKAPGGNKDYCLKLVKNLFGQKQAGRVWNKHLHNGLTSIGFTQSKYEECLYFRNKTILLVYVDDLIIMSREESDVNQAFKDIQAAGFDINCVGSLSEYLGIQIQQTDNGNIHLKQPTIIKQILHGLNFNQRTKVKQNPAKIGTTLDKATKEPSHDANWDYRSIIGKINYLEQSTRPDIAFAAHQAARFQADPRQPHTKAVQWLGRYLHGTQDKGIILSPNNELFQVYADADFAGTWDPETAPDDSDTARSRMGYLVTFAGCPITWTSKLISEIVLSTTEAEYVSLSESLRTVIPLLNIYKECQQRKIMSK